MSNIIVHLPAPTLTMYELFTATEPPNIPTAVAELCLLYICCYCHTVAVFTPSLVWCAPPPAPPTVQRRTRGRGVQRPRCKHGAHVCTCLHMSAALIRIWKALGGCIWYSGVQILDRAGQWLITMCRVDWTWAECSRAAVIMTEHGEWSCLHPAAAAPHHHSLFIINNGRKM